MTRALLSGDNPYASCRGTQSDGVTPNTANPVTTALFVIPFLPLSPIMAASVFVGLSSALLAYGVFPHGRERLLIFLAFPYWQALQVVQWSPLLLAVAFLPALLPLTLVKPHTGAVVALSNLSRPRIIASLAVIGLSLLARPAWPFEMLNAVGAPGDYRMPLLVMPFGPLIALTALCWRDPRARFLLLFALTPQRMFYDLFLLWTLPRTRNELMGLAILSWIVYLLWYRFSIDGYLLMIMFLYLPITVTLLLQNRSVARSMPASVASSSSAAD